MAAPLLKVKSKVLKQFLQKLWSCKISYRECSTIKQSIKDLLQTELLEHAKKDVVAEGWLKSIRKQKMNTFFHVNDGSCLTGLQVVADSSLCPGELSYGSSVTVKGDLVPSPAKGQRLELQARDIQVHGFCDGMEFPFKYRGTPGPDFIRTFPHLRPRMDYNSCLLRVRNAASVAVHNFFQDNGFIFIHTPMITSNDCEGAGEVFTVQGPLDRLANQTDSSDDDQNLSEDVARDKSQFFGHPVFLTVSGQLHLEAITGAFKQAYSFGPTFRAENAQGRHHLCEFYMIEAEIAFTQSQECLMKVMEELIKSVTQEVMSRREEDIDYFRKTITDNRDDIIRKIQTNRFERLPYTEGIKILEKNNENFQFKVSWGCDLQKEHEQYLVQHCDNIPVFVTDFPATIKPFYAKANTDTETVAAVDLLLPDCGELCGGSLREDNYDILKTRMNNLGLKNHYEWYLDLRKFGSVPHGGFGMGFERYLQFLLGIPNIKDTVPFPRWGLQCKL